MLSIGSLLIDSLDYIMIVDKNYNIILKKIKKGDIL